MRLTIVSLQPVSPKLLAWPSTSAAFVRTAHQTYIFAVAMNHYWIVNYAAFTDERISWETFVAQKAQVRTCLS
jgi:hypothetical protein